MRTIDYEEVIHTLCILKNISYERFVSNSKIVLNENYISSDLKTCYEALGGWKSLDEAIRMLRLHYEK